MTQQNVLSKNPAILNLLKSERTDSGRSPDSRMTKSPSDKAREALYLLHSQAKGSPPPNSYCSTVPYIPLEGGDSAAIRDYAILICEHVKKLNAIVTTRRDLILPFSRTCLSWPMLISKRKVFGDDSDKLIRDLQVGEETIANDSAARFNPGKRFGRIALELIERIEHYRATPAKLVSFQESLSNTRCIWAVNARQLHPFARNASADEKKAWLKVAKKVLKADFCNPDLKARYLGLITAPSHQEHKESKFFDKIRGEFDSLWGLHSRKK